MNENDREKRVGLVSVSVWLAASLSAADEPPESGDDERLPLFFYVSNCYF
jgi:hypothetical protein